MDVSRYEINRQVRTALIRHDVNLSLIDYSTVGSTVYLSGELYKGSSEEFLPPVIEELTREIARLPGVRDIQFDLLNWSITGSPGFYEITKKKRKTPSAAGRFPGDKGAVSTDSTYEIKSDENIADVLKDVGKGNSDEEGK